MSSTEAQLEADLAKMAEISKQAEAFLGTLAEALFPEGLPGKDKVTWAEKSSAREQVVQSAQDRLAAAEVRFRTLVEQIPAVTFLAVLGDGKNEIYVSPHIEQMLGFSQAEWLEAPFLWFWQLHPDDRQIWNDEFTRGCQTGGPFKAECRFIARDGHIVWVRGEARLVKDDQGRPMLLQGIAFDITESKKAQEILLAEATRTARHQQELAIARRVQTSILPRDMAVKGLEMSAVMLPADDIGGDYYDVQKTEGGAWVAIGDVSGHGLDAGLVMMMLQSAMSAIGRARPDITPREAVLHLNSLLYENVRTRLRHDDHVTMTVFRYREDGTFTFAGAHEDILICRASGVIETVRTPGTWVGGMEDISRTTVDSTLKLGPGDVMLLYTDGITEAMSPAGELFELQRLSTAFAAVHRHSVEEIRDTLLKTVRGWMAKQDDDMSLFVIRYTGAGSGAQAAAPKDGGPKLHTTSALTGMKTVPVPQLTVDGAPNRLSSIAAELQGTLAVKLTGTCETLDVAPLKTLLDEMHGLATRRAYKVVELDVSALKFMGSSCFKQLVSWLAAVQAIPAAQQYKVRFVADPQVRWQRTGVTALTAFAPEVLAS